ncbi:MAG: heavy metal translocating P-type ATPase [Ghiorsea sp.]
MSQKDEKACFHCGLTLPSAGIVLADIQEKEQAFCCSGCAQVCEIIYSSGLDSFYDFAPEERAWGNPEVAPEDAKVFDRPEIQADFVRQRPNGDYQSDLLIEGIHCPACVWLIEHTVSQLPGVTFAEVSLTRRKLRLRWEPNTIKLSDVILAIGRIGYQAIPYEDDLEQLANKKHRQDLLFRMAFAGFIFANVMTAAVCLYGGDFFGIAPKWRSVFQWYSMVLTFAGIMYAGHTFFRSAWKAITSRKPNMDLPISIGISSSFLWSSYVTIMQPKGAESHVYFDSICMFIFLILVGRFLESSARETAGTTTRHLLALLPRSARKKTKDGNVELIPLRSVKQSDILLIKPGDRMPVDGIVVLGSSDADESIITGESKSVRKIEGDQVIGGTLNISGSLEVRATHLGQDSVLSQIVELVEQAQDAKVKIQGLADKIVPWFVTIVLTLSLATFAFWLWHADFEFAAITAITVLIITCPCALGLATPMAISIGGGLGGKLGILIKRGSALEQMLHLQHIVFDKTGTLTLGQVQVQQQFPLADNKDVLCSQILGLEQASEHPLASAIEQHLKGHKPDVSFKDFNNHAGQGVSAIFAETTLHIGSLGWLFSKHISINNDTMAQFEAEEDKGYTIAAVFDDNTLLAWFTLGDELRPEAKLVVHTLQQQGIQVSILTGDREKPAMAIAKQLASDQHDIQVFAEVLPGQKSDKIKSLQAKNLLVGMIGDGVNDAPALTQANVGIAMGQATDVSAQAADVVLLGGLKKLPLAIQLSSQTMRTIKQNLGLSLGYNALVIPLAIGGYIHPLFAAIAMPVSSFLVIGNALLIHKRVKE